MRHFLIAFVVSLIVSIVARRLKNAILRFENDERLTAKLRDDHHDFEGRDDHLFVTGIR